MGAKQGAFTHEDIEAFKYTFNKMSMYRLAVKFCQISCPEFDNSNLKRTSVNLQTVVSVKNESGLWNF